MFESGGASTGDLLGLLSALSGLGPAVDDAERVTQLDLLERVKAACSAAQVRVTVELAESQPALAEQWREDARAAAEVGDFDMWRAARESMRRASCPEADDGTPGSGAAGRRARGRRPRVDVGVAAQVALARRESPHTGSRLVGMAFVLTHEMPHLFALLERGLLSERRAALVVRECAALSLDQRGTVDAELHATLGDEVGVLSHGELASRVRAISYRLDAKAVLERAAYAERERRVTLRPAPDTMCWLTALLPAAQGVAAFAALTKAADSARAAGETRGRGQVMADTLVERVTGQTTAAAVSVEVQVVLTDRALLADDVTPARLSGYGTVPAEWARQVLRRGSEGPAQVWVRRLYTHPADGTLVAMDSRRRVFDGALRRLLIARDGGTCRTPGCGAPVRHLDHVGRFADGGSTSAVSGQGLCARCNLVKELPGWRSTVVAADPHTVEITTPTGHRYASHAPPVLPEETDVEASPLERLLTLAA